MRYSKQRRLILDTVLKNKVHPSADYIYNLLKDENPELSLGTVYRNLNFLAQNNMLKKINIPNGSDRFDGTLSKHQHVICTECGKVVDICVPELAKICDTILDKTGFEVNCDSLAFEGLCAECREKLQLQIKIHA